MKKVLIQDRSADSPYLDAIQKLVQIYFNGKLEIETTNCLSKTNFDITNYNLIIAHIHPFGNCCVPYMLKARKKNIPILLTYKVRTKEIEKVETIATKFDIKLEGIRLYSDIIKSLEGKF